VYLSDHEIIDAVRLGDIVLSDFDETRVQPTSYDILLGNKFLSIDTHKTPVIDPVKKILPEYREIVIEPEGHFVLHPGVSILGTSADYFGSEKYLIHLSGKSSLARLGLIVHNTAGVINPGHFLNITFELANLNSVPIILRPGMPIAQLLFSQISSPPRQQYHQTGRYHTDNWKGYVEK
jgi:dCTP deaminase